MLFPFERSGKNNAAGSRIENYDGDQNLYVELREKQGIKNRKRLLMGENVACSYLDL